MNSIYINDEEYVMLPVPSCSLTELAPELAVLPMLEMLLLITQRMISSNYLNRECSNKPRTRLLQRIDMLISELQEVLEYYQKLRSKEVENQTLDADEDIPF